MWRPYHPRLPWILILENPSGVFVRDTRSGASKQVRSQLELAEFAAAHSAAPGRYGLGDIVHGIAKRLGLGADCTPCAQRQAALNARAPSVFRR